MQYNCQVPEEPREEHQAASQLETLPDGGDQREQQI